MYALLLPVVFAAALVLTMVGLGGGLIFSPVFVLAGMGKAQAASASLFLNLVAAASAAWVYGRKGMVDFRLAIPLIVSSSLAAPLGSWLNQRVEMDLFMGVMAVVLVLAAVRMLLGPKAIKRPEGGRRMGKAASGVLVGAAIGLLAGLLGIGGGVFVVPLLIFLVGVETKAAAASSTFIVCFSSLFGFLGYAAQASVNWSFILPAAVLAFAGGQIGSRVMSAKLNTRLIHVIFAGVLLLLAARLGWRVVAGG
ncbi:sulfite exporter TauE/SafE family protein [Desulfohalovibrio reitneri]|uniref:sulfite exporter TauE/SafE family protein n=1 Tax=Desulfohalovibrio reitneri TaxID=1307759 RepID=UPI001376801D|nr:sulfite exporter TauE/SafE family protein [Desulfohalovibrio reitneri]